MTNLCKGCNTHATKQVGAICAECYEVAADLQKVEAWDFPILASKPKPYCLIFVDFRRRKVMCTERYNHE